jgi:hypothetical protein
MNPRAMSSWAENKAPTLHSTDLIERGLPDHDIAVDQLAGRHRCTSARPTIPGQGIVPADRGTFGGSLTFGLGIASLTVPGTLPGDATMDHDSPRS